MAEMGLVERERECSKLGEIVRHVAAGTGGVGVVQGPPGIGKSALLAWLADESRTAGLRAQGVRATELGASVSFGVARRLLEDEVRRRRGSWTSAGRAAPARCSTAMPPRPGSRPR